MEQSVQKYFGIMKELIDAKKMTAVQEFSSEDANVVRQLLTDFDSLLNYDNFMEFVTERFAKDSIKLS